MAQAATTQERSPTLAIQPDGERLLIVFDGAWTTRAITDQDQALADAEVNGCKRVRLSLAGVEALDTTGAWLVYRTSRGFEQQGIEVEVTGADPSHSGLIETVAAHDQPCPAPPPETNALIDLVAYTGRETMEVFAECGRLINFLGHTVSALLRALFNPRSIRVVMLVSHMERAGINALPIVGLISFLIGVVLAYQGADQLARFGAQIFTVNLVGYGVLREMGILLTAIIVAGRSGSAFTAQIGTMKVNEEIDALRTLGLDPMDVLVLPRVLALVLVMPLLTFYADIMGLFGGAVMANIELDISFYQFARQLNTAVPIESFIVGMVKAPIFAFIIAMVGCYEGLKVSRSAESVGERTTAAVVKSIFLVIVLDALASVFFSVIGI
ncbi:MAG: MlaE family lipid ABC transporter permease subunit [Pseudomonadota bacterium]